METKMHRFSAKAVFSVVLAAMLAVSMVALTGCSGDKQYSEDQIVKVDVGYWGGTCEAPLYVAYEKGFFQKYGIDANMVKITSGSSQFLADAGDGAAIFEATPNFLPAIANGLDVKYISEVHTGCIQACATAASGVTSVKDLEGKTVGTFTANDMGQIFLSKAMINAGADPSTVTWVAEGNIGTMMKAAANGEIVAFCNFDPYVEVCTQYFDGQYVEIFDNATDPNFKDMTCCFLAGNNTVYSDPDVAKRVASAVNDACAWIDENPDEAADIISGNNDSGTTYCTPSAALLSAFGVDESKANDSNLHKDLIENYTWGNVSEEHFKNSLKGQWETVADAGFLPEGKSVDELVELCGAYCGL